MRVNGVHGSWEIQDQTVPFENRLERYEALTQAHDLIVQRIAHFRLEGVQGSICGLMMLLGAYAHIHTEKAGLL